MSSDAINRRIASGLLRPIHRGVYLVGHLAAAPLAYEAAAILAFDGRAVISHRSAAKLHGLLPWPSGADVWVTREHGSCDRPGLIARASALEPRDITRHHRIPVTGAARTILDCATVLPVDEDDRLEAMCAEAHALGKARLPDLRSQIERNRGRRGVARLKRVIDRSGGPSRTKRELERRLLRLIRSSDVPEPETNAALFGREVDLLWRGQQVAVEADSYTFHSHSRAWARDIGRSNELQLQGFVVLRFTWRDVTERPGWVVDEIRRALQRRR